MEAITGNNYEIWFLDYLDGRLDDGQLSQLLDFLEANPQLKEELQGITGVRLTIEEEKFPAIGSLLKSHSDIPGISADDRLCIARLENDLTAAEAAAFEERIHNEPALGRTYASFQFTKLRPEVLLFPYKADLRHKTRFLAPWVLTVVSTAAIVVLALILWPQGTQNVTDLPEQNGKTAIMEDHRDLAPAGPGYADPEKLIASVSRKKNPAANIDNPVTVVPVRDTVPINSLGKKNPDIRISMPDPVRTPVVFASVFANPSILAIPDEKYLTLPQYALQLFREKILGEDPVLVRRTRFSMWEVAGAGVDKINVLAGTEMKLNREYDASGQILAVSFNSRLLDVETPIRTPENNE